MVQTRLVVVVLVEVVATVVVVKVTVAPLVVAVVVKSWHRMYLLQSSVETNLLVVRILMSLI